MNKPSHSHVSYLKGNFLERLIAFLIDEIILLLIFCLLIYIAKINFYGKTYLSIISESPLLFPFLAVVYNISLIHKYEATLGKRIMRLKVVDETYKKISFGKLLLRETIGKWISDIILDLGYLSILWDKRSQGWHDKIARSYVVKQDKSGHLIKGENPSLGKKIRILLFFLFFAWGLPVVLSLFVLIYLFAAQPHQMKGDSMSPAILNNQYFITDKLTYKFSPPQRGDIVIFKSPVDKNKDMIKRIIGLPGEQVRMTEGKIFINYKRLDEKYISPNTYTRVDVYTGFIKEGVPVTIPKNQYFVLGDNRTKSSDSREWGFVPKENIIGKYWFRYF